MGPFSTETTGMAFICRAVIEGLTLRPDSAYAGDELLEESGLKQRENQDTGQWLLLTGRNNSGCRSLWIRRACYRTAQKKISWTLVH